MFCLGNAYPSYGPLKLAKKWSYPNCHWSIFEDFIFWKIIFKNLAKQNIFFTHNFFSKEKFFWKNFMIGKNILFCMIFENSFSENEIFENWSMAVGIWLFFGQLQRLITRMCSTQTKLLIPLNDSTHQHLFTEI